MFYYFNFDYQVYKLFAHLIQVLCWVGYSLLWMDLENSQDKSWGTQYQNTGNMVCPAKKVSNSCNSYCLPVIIKLNKYLMVRSIELLNITFTGRINEAKSLCAWLVSNMGNKNVFGDNYTLIGWQWGLILGTIEVQSPKVLLLTLPINIFLTVYGSSSSYVKQENRDIHTICSEDSRGWKECANMVLNWILK